MMNINFSGEDKFEKMINKVADVESFWAFIIYPNLEQKCNAWLWPTFKVKNIIG